jgi:hypothetical protein
MPPSDRGSLTKEPPLKLMDETIQAVQPEMSYADLLRHARSHTHRDAPGLVRQRFLYVERGGRIVFDRFLSLVNREPITSHYVRKVMFFVWAFRDDRLRKFICGRVANPQGRWRVQELLRKENSEFFEQWFDQSTARKARSNIEYFLVDETKIANRESRKVDLNLSDRWLMEAMAIAAQHEPDPFERRRILEDPIQYLIDHEWTGLANATADELLELGPPAIEQAAPLEDETIQPSSSGAESKEWNREQPKRGAKQTTQAYIDLVARERASRSHHMLERITVDSARRLNYEPKYNANIDLFFETPHGTVLAEMKSCDGKNLHSQVRRGVSQLLEYSFLYREVLGQDPVLVLIVETPPPAEKAWLREFLASLDITLAWKKPWEEQLVASSPVPKALTDIIRREPE